MFRPATAATPNLVHHGLNIGNSDSAQRDSKDVRSAYPALNGRAMARQSITLEWGPWRQLRSMHGSARAAWWSRPATVPRAPLPLPSIAHARARDSTPGPRRSILNWKSFAGDAWERRSGDARLLLNAIQENVLWVEIAGQDRSMATLLEGPRYRLASLASEAHELLCSYAPQFLRSNSRVGWQQDAAAFSEWLTAFDEACRSGNLFSPSRLPNELIPALKADTTKRPPLLLAGFDRILPVQRDLFDAWGEWHVVAPEQTGRFS